MALVPTLLVEEGPDKGRKFSTEKVQFRIGRSEEKCDFALSGDDAAISREHFAIIRRGETFIFNNLSRNGSSINGVKTEQALLRDNDLIKVGLSTVIRFTLEDKRDMEINPGFR